MSANSTQTAFLPAAWSEALDGIQHALDEAVAGAAEREQQLQTQTPGNELNAPAWQEHLKRLDEHLALMQASSQQPEKGAQEADATLAACETALKEWLAASAAHGQKLAKWAGGAI